MKIGLMTLGTFFLIFFLILINTSEITPEQIDQVFENVDVNILSNMDENISDANLGKFIKYTAKGIGNELHGGYYLVSWLNPLLPKWLVTNSELLVVILILFICAPIIATVLNWIMFIIIALCLWASQKLKEKKEAVKK